MRIALITNCFPYLPGEQFLEEEVKYWAETSLHITLLPVHAVGDVRPSPYALAVNKALALAEPSGLKKISIYLSVAVNSIFFKEMIFLCKRKKLRGALVREAIVNIYSVLLYREALKEYIDKNGPIDIVYCYWNDLPAYAACLLKGPNSIGKVVSRVHGYDLYAERRASSYMPLKWQFVSRFDTLYAISSQGRRYLIDEYSANPDNIFVAPLGVAVLEGGSRRSVGRFIHIASISFCVPVKRIDRIIEAVHVFSSKNPGIKVLWTHIGGGALLDALKITAAGVLGHLDNVRYDFVGEVDNVDVRDFLRTRSIDVFVNSSEHEGVPVSIMEAMSAGIPAVAPDVGGVSTLVSTDCGYLLKPDPSGLDIADGISAVYFNPEVDRMRIAAKERIARKFNAKINYPSIIHAICGQNCVSLDDSAPSAHLSITEAGGRD